VLKIPVIPLEQQPIMTEAPSQYAQTPSRRWADLQRGFTLIELMIGIAILSMLLLFGLPGLGGWIQSSQIRNASESIQGGLQLARAEAVRRNTNVQFVMPSLVGGGVASDWTVTCVTPSTDCPGAGMAKTEIQQRAAAEGSPNAQVAAGQATIVFNGMGRVTPTPTADIVLNVTNPTGGTCAASSGTMRCLRISVSAGGQVRMCDPALSLSTNPRGCN
jgi:type IV fimbrial biogenesis protein FimT